MPNIKTIKPAGGGDYTTLQAWEDFADGEAIADQHAECYTGGDLGALTISLWTATPTASFFPRVYAAVGEGHGGDKTAGAFGTGSLVVNTNFTHIEGLRINGNAFNLGNASNVEFNECLSHDSAGIAGFNVATFEDMNDISATLKNCISIDSASYGFLLGGDNMIGGTVTVTAYNCVSYNAGDEGFNAVNGKSTTGGGVVLIENCISMVSFGKNFDNNVTGGDGSVTMNNNLSSDLTADDFGGAGHVVGETDTDVFTDPVNDDYSLKSGSAAVDAGKDTGVTSDIIGTARPQGSAYDMGAFELLVVVLGGGPASRTALTIGIGI